MKRLHYFKSMLINIIFLIMRSQAQEASMRPPNVRCHSHVPEMSTDQYINDDTDLKIITRLEVVLDLYQTSCVYLELKPTSNASNPLVGSLFYTFEYAEYVQHYGVESQYKFGIPEFQSHCKCDCPKGDDFCHADHKGKKCDLSEICYNTWHKSSAAGCENKGDASLCCQVTVKPFQGRTFTSIDLKQPTAEAVLNIVSYIRYGGEWQLFRNYQRRILPQKGNSLYLNGHENHAKIQIRSESKAPHFSLDTEAGKYYFENNKRGKQLSLRLKPAVNDIHETSKDKYGWLRLRKNGGWYIPSGAVTIQDIHAPIVQNCKGQTYTDQYDVSQPILIIRNRTNHVAGKVQLGNDVRKIDNFIKTIQLVDGPTADLNEMSVIVAHQQNSAPTLNLDIQIHQVLRAIAHLQSSYFKTFNAIIKLDKNANRYLNITLVDAQGKFSVSVKKPYSEKDTALILSLTTPLPMTANYTSQLSLPSYVDESRYICVSASQKPENEVCSMIGFDKDPVEAFEIEDVFVQTEGNCPGCNTEKASTFLEFLNPKNWFNGINSVSEGMAMIFEILLYIAIAIGIIALLRKVGCPLMRWALCSSGPAPKKVNNEVPEQKYALV